MRYKEFDKSAWRESSLLLFVLLVVGLLFAPMAGRSQQLQGTGPVRTAFDCLNTIVPGTSVTNTRPIIQKAIENGQTDHGAGDEYLIFMEQNRRRGYYEAVGNFTAKGPVQMGYCGEGVIGNYYGYTNAKVTLRQAGSGGVIGSAGGWGASAFGIANGALSQNWGEMQANSWTFAGSPWTAEIGETAEFTATGDVFGIVGAYSNTSSGIVWVSVDNDFTLANGPEIQTATQGDVDNGKFASTFVDSYGNTQTTVGSKYYDFRRQYTYYAQDIGIYEDLTYANASHTIRLVNSGKNNQKDTSAFHVQFSGFFVSSPSDTAISGNVTNGASQYPTASNSSGRYIFRWREINGPQNGVVHVNTKPVVGAAFNVLDGVHEFKSSTGSNYNFNRRSHSDITGDTTNGPQEAAHVPYYLGYGGLLNSAGNAAAQANLTLRTGDGAGFANNDWVWIQSKVPQLRQISSIATDVLTLTSNLTYRVSGYERVIRCEATVSTVTASTSATLSTSSVNIARGDAIAFVIDGVTPVTAIVKSISGTTLTLDHAVTVSNGAGVIRLWEAANPNGIMVDNQPLYMVPGAIWAVTDKCEIRRTLPSASGDDRTTTSATATNGSTSLTVTSSTNFFVGDRCIIDSNGTQVRKVTAIPDGTHLTLDTGVSGYIHSGVRVTPVGSVRREVVTYMCGTPWQVKVQFEETDWRCGDFLRAVYPCMIDSGALYQPLAPPTFTITGATTASPIVCTAANHGLMTGDLVIITGSSGLTGLNGSFVVTRLSSNTFSLNGSTGTGTWSSGGTVAKTYINEFQFFDSVVAGGPTIAPTVYQGLVPPTPWNTGSTVIYNVVGATWAAKYSTSSNLVYACKLDDEDLMNLTLMGASSLNVLNNAGSTKIYWQAGSGSVPEANRAVNSQFVYRAAYRRTFRRDPRFRAVLGVK